METQILLITPPFTQLNTPYPGTVYLKGFLNTKNVRSFQADLGIEVLLSLFSHEGLEQLFSRVATLDTRFWSENALRIFALRQSYIDTIEGIILFLQGKNDTLAHAIVMDDFLPQAQRFNHLEDMEWNFGAMGTLDKAKHYATLYLEDLSDFIVETIDPHFGFSRYAERLGRSANSFDEMYAHMAGSPTFIDEITLVQLQKLITATQPKVIGFSVPFPGNLYSAFRCAQFIKKHYPAIKITMGGGFPNTELRAVSDLRVFEFFDFITLDDGEAPVEQLLRYVNKEIESTQLKRTFLVENHQVVYQNSPLVRDYKQAEVGCPDYTDLLLDQYISVIEILNPMHRLWSDGRWNKLTMAHGCYWGKCTFCDISLDYIKIYEPVTARLIVDRMQELIEKTNNAGFHFVDEAAPPALMREVALEILRRNLSVSWWTNIRFEKSFTYDLCRLLKASGCIAVSGGLEVASDRLLQLIDKGVTVEQVARVNRNFTQAGIMVHAYLMYGFPTQTAQETIDSLEMVRQMFESGILQSGFWHQFAMTAHSPVGLDPEKFQVVNTTPEVGSFANNDLIHEEKSGAKHDKFSFGLKKSLFNYMHGICFDFSLQEWFDFKVPSTKVAPTYIADVLSQEPFPTFKPNQKVVFLGTVPEIQFFTKTKKGRSFEKAELTLHTKKETLRLTVEAEEGLWLEEMIQSWPTRKTPLLFKQLKDSFEQKTSEDFEPFWYGKSGQLLREKLFLIV